jgi:NNP family nitrate/nitrite transporter-like MFS transporter
MIPLTFATKSLDLKDVSSVEAANWARSRSGALIGIAGAIGALGGVGINIVLRASYAGADKSATMALWVFLAFYLVCLAVTWSVFVRRMVPTGARLASDATAGGATEADGVPRSQG